MKMHIKVLNLYAGIGGNRKLWKDVEVTAVENNEQIAVIYQDFFQDDTVIVADAHQYLLDHFKEFDFIWSSPPCPTHSDIRRCGIGVAGRKEVYPDMALYQEIILLQHFGVCKWAVENVRPYYEPLIIPQKISQHYFWASFHISSFNTSRQHFDSQGDLQALKGMDISKYKPGIRKDKILRNCVLPELGKHIFDCAYRKEKALRLFK